MHKRGNVPAYCVLWQAATEEYKRRVSLLFKRPERSVLYSQLKALTHQDSQLSSQHFLHYEIAPCIVLFVCGNGVATPILDQILSMESSRPKGRYDADKGRL